MQLAPFDIPLSVARAETRQGAEKGTTCPCCDQTVKVYKRQLGHTSAAAIVALYKDAYRGWAHMPTIMQRHLPQAAGQGGYSVLGKHWGLIEEEVAVRRKDGGRAGWWRVTNQGHLFVNGLLEVHKFVQIYNGTCLGMTGPLIDVQQALGAQFDLAELMAA